MRIHNFILLALGASSLLLSCENLSQSSEDVIGEIRVQSVPRELYYRAHNDDFTVKVRPQGGEWIDLYEYKVKVDMDKPQEASMVTFDFSGKVDIMVKKNNGNVQSAQIRPLSKAIKHKLKDNILSFSLEKPENLSIEFDGNRLTNLHLFTNSLEENIPSPGDTNVVYFAPGFHKPENGAEFFIPSNSKVYLAPGAVLNGTLVCDKVENVEIFGRGLLWEPNRGVQISFSKSVRVSDIIIVDPRHYTLLGGQSEDITVKNIRSFSYQGWSDGIDMMSCNDVHISNVFMRNSDDCIAVYGPRWEYMGDSRNIVVENSTLWADIAHPINIGTHGYTADGVGNVLENLVFKNIDILEHDEDDPPYEGCMAICCGDLNLIRNILFDNVRVERVQEGRLFNVEVMYNEKYNTAPGKSVENIIFSNIQCNASDDLGPSIIKGLDAEHIVKDIQFKSVYINGKLLKSIDQFHTNEFISNIIFTK